VGVLGHLDPVSRVRGRLRAEADRADPGRYLPRPHQLLGQRCNQNDQQGRQPSPREDRADLPQRRKRHELQLHRLPLARQRIWKSKIGKGTQPSFPTGVGARGSSGVAGKLKSTPGGITYVDVAYSLKNHFTIAKIKNRGGRFQLPGLRQIQAAADSIRKLKNSQNAFTAVDPNPRAPKAYPICTFTWVIVPLKTGKAADLKKFITWALTSGQTFGAKLLFVPIPKAAKKAGQKTLARVHS